eukprot:scaffold1268_cov387-Pavlova_lutheri.AAC.3
MAINLAKAEERMQFLSNQTRTSKTFAKGETIKLQGGRATRSDQRKLQPCYRVTEIVRSLGKDNYEIRLPEGNNIHAITAYPPKFPLAQQLGPSELPSQAPQQPTDLAQKYPVRECLLRNWNSIPPRYYVQWDTPAKELGWAYEDDALISDVAVYERVNGILPETGITTPNKAAILKHKQVKIQQKTPTVQNTWTGKATWAAAIGRASTVKLTSLQALPKANLHRVVQKRFDEQGLLMYYAGQVIAAPKAGVGRYTIRYTDGYEEAVTHQELERLLYKASSRID